MRWIAEDDEYELASGRRVYANQGLLSVSRQHGQWAISEGYDSGVDVCGRVRGLTTPERVEIADHMIALWTDYREAVKNGA